jgi:hypothetical protein
MAQGCVGESLCFVNLARREERHGTSCHKGAAK